MTTISIDDIHLILKALKTHENKIQSDFNMCLEEMERRDLTEQLLLTRALSTRLALVLHDLPIPKGDNHGL